MRKQSRAKQFGRIEKRYEKNEQITAEKLRVIDIDDNNLGIISRNEALTKAKELGVDLVIIAKSEGQPPVAKIIDWAKFKYEQNKKTKKAKKNQVTTKEWRFGANIEERDMEMKLEQAKAFLTKESGKVKLTVRSVKRAQPYQVQETMDRLLERVGDFSELASEVQREGRNLSVYIKNKD